MSDTQERSNGEVRAHLAKVAESRQQLDEQRADEYEQLRASVLTANARAERLAQRIVTARRALLMGGQTADIRCRAAISALDAPSGVSGE